MITTKAKHKLKVLNFWKQYGLKAALAAFGVSRRTLFNWQAVLQADNNNPESLNDHHKRPQHIRVRCWPEVIKNEIKRLRDEHPNLGKDKIQVFIVPFCQTNQLPCPVCVYYR